MTNAARDLIEINPHGSPVAQQPITPMEMLNTALSRGADITVLEKLMGLQERWEANQARKAFDAAIAAAKGEIPPIIRNREVDFTSSKGRTNYRHEDFAGIARIVDPILQRHGLTYRHKSEQNGQKLRVTCVLSHRDGHSEETSLEAVEDHSGNKNSIQAIGSAATYLQRYTLKLALGLSTSNDDDGKSARPPQDAADLRAEGERIAREEGAVALGNWWMRTISKEDRKTLGEAALVELKKLAGA